MHDPGTPNVNAAMPDAGRTDQPHYNNVENPQFIFVDRAPVLPVFVTFELTRDRSKFERRDFTISWQFNVEFRLINQIDQPPTMRAVE